MRSVLRLKKDRTADEEARLFRRLGVVCVVLSIPYAADMYLSGFPWVAATGILALLGGLGMVFILPQLVERGNKRQRSLDN